MYIQRLISASLLVNRFYTYTHAFSSGSDLSFAPGMIESWPDAPVRAKIPWWSYNHTKKTEEFFLTTSLYFYTWMSISLSSATLLNIQFLALIYMYLWRKGGMDNVVLWMCKFSYSSCELWIEVFFLYNFNAKAVKNKVEINCRKWYGM